MRLHTLRLRGVGPFKDEFSIDFDEVGGHRLFLIDGDTGTGKSTVIDAIVFALYGRTAEDDAGDRMVSDFLPADFKKADRPFVELVFSVESGVYRVRREPKYDYINRNGKEAVQQPTLRLERLDNETSTTGTLISTSLQEGNSEIGRIVQLSSGQFLATVVLAQGQFATFLRAGPDERREILERVFGTEQYRKVEQLLKERKSVATGERREASDRCQDAAARFHEVAEIAVPADEWWELAARDPEQVVTQAEARLAEVVDAAATAARAKSAAEQVHQAAVAKHEAAKKRAGLVVEKRQLLVDQTELHAAGPAIDAHRLALATDAKAKTVQPHRKAKTKAVADAADKVAAAVACRTGLDQADATLAASTADDLDDHIGRAVTQLAADTGELNPMWQLEQSLPAAAIRSDQAKARSEQLAAELQSTANAAAELPAQIQQLREQMAQRSQLAAALEPRQAEVTIAKQGRAAAGSAVRLGQDYAAANESLNEATAALRAATETAHRIESDYHANIAGVLATQLQPAEPCPVCGGLEHPNPAPTPSAEVTKAAVDDARQKVDQRRHAAEAERTTTEELGAKVAAAQALAQSRSVEAWEADVAVATAAVEKARGAAKEVADLDAQVRQLEAKHTTLDQLQRDLTGQEATARADAEQQRRQVADDTEVVAAARGGFASVADRIAGLRDRRDKLQAWLRARNEAAQAQVLAEQAAAVLTAALAEGGFADESAVDAALLGGAEEQELKARVAAHDKRAAQIEGRLDSEDLAQVDPDEAVDIQGPQAAAEAAVAELTTATAEATIASQRATVTQSTCATLRQSAGKFAEVDARVAPIIRIADIVNGSGPNTLGVPLSHYVVLKRFEDVLQAANSRLLTISDGRYRLEPDTTARQGQKVRRGLGLRIVDERTDQARSVSTLSGGETFYTSLSLALGLADVVSQEAGGVQMRTLFVDEGFGSLDTETLDAVMSVLGTLSQGDRMVGVISHVTEMKHSIPFRIHVRRPDRDGPSVILTPS